MTIDVRRLAFRAAIAAVMAAVLVEATVVGPAAGEPSALRLV
jgi:hypothetical protein